MFSKDQIDNWFTYHPPVGDQAQAYETIRFHARTFAHVINELVPDGADKSDAIRKLRETVMTANAGIATSPHGDSSSVMDVVSGFLKAAPLPHQTTFTGVDGTSQAKISKPVNQNLPGTVGLDSLVSKFIQDHG